MADGSLVANQPTRNLLVIEMKWLAVVVGQFGRVGARTPIKGVVCQSGSGSVRSGKRQER